MCCYGCYDHLMPINCVAHVYVHNVLFYACSMTYMYFAVVRMAQQHEANVANVETQLNPLHQRDAQKNSPLAVAQEYELLYSNEWQDAKLALDEYSDWKVKDRDKYEILISTLMVRSAGA